MAPLRCENKASFERQSYRHMLACWHGLAVMCMLGENDLKMSHWQLTCLFGQGPEKRTRRFHAGEYVTIFASSLDHILTGLGISLFLMHSPTAMLCHCALSLSHVSHSKSDCLLSIVSTCGPAAWTTDRPGTWEQLAVASTGGSSGSSLVRVTVPQSTATYSLTTGHSKMVRMSTGCWREERGGVSQSGLTKKDFLLITHED